MIIKKKKKKKFTSRQIRAICDSVNGRTSKTSRISVTHPPSIYSIITFLIIDEKELINIILKLI